VIGISADNLAAQKKFIADRELNFPLLADDQLKMSKALGVMSDKGKVTRRVTFVIDKQGKIAKIYEKVTPKGHPTEVLKFVQEDLGKKS
jgi:peroxiredoxin Q/BCP